MLRKRKASLFVMIQQVVSFIHLYSWTSSLFSPQSHSLFSLILIFIYTFSLHFSPIADSSVQRVLQWKTESSHSASMSIKYCLTGAKLPPTVTVQSYGEGMKREETVERRWEVIGEALRRAVPFEEHDLWMKMVEWGSTWCSQGQAASPHQPHVKTWLI